MPALDARIESISVAAYEIPTDSPESDGTLEWDSTTCVIVEVAAAGQAGLGYTYSHVAAGHLIAPKLAGVLRGRDAFATAGLHAAMRGTLRNLGEGGLGAMAISVIDVALWDLKARLLGTSLVRLLGAAREAVPIYGSGGFTSYSVERLCRQLAGWIEQGIPRVKMKVGRDPDRDESRVKAAREAIGPEAELFVDANGGYDRKQALAKAEAFAEFGVTWFEEPVSKYDHEGLRFVRDQAPAGMEVTAGEYGWMPLDFRRLIEAGAVDVLQADVTRCGGVTGFMSVAAQCEAAFLPLSSHCAPALTLPVAAAAGPLRNVEYFHDHVRIERMLFDGFPEPKDGALRADLQRPGHGLDLKRMDAERYLVWRSGD